MGVYKNMALLRGLCPKHVCVCVRVRACACAYVWILSFSLDLVPWTALTFLAGTCHDEIHICITATADKLLAAVENVVITCSNNKSNNSSSNNNNSDNDKNWSEKSA